MKQEVKGTASNDLGNAFIWSAFKYYLRQPTDSYVVYSPVKYWKAQHLIDKRFIDGFAFNRRWFHTHIDACIMVALWSNEPAKIERISISGYDIGPDGLLQGPISLPVIRIHSKYSSAYYDKRAETSDTQGGVLLGYDGKAAGPDVKTSLTPIFNADILGYMVIDGSNFDNPDLMSVLIRAGLYKGHGFYLRSDNYLTKLPMFCASRYITYNRAWTERGRIMKSADGAVRFNTDVASGKLDQWLRKCLLFTCVEMQNHMRSFIGSDGRFYRNELCLDTTNGPTKASSDLAALHLNKTETQLLEQWNLLIGYVRSTPEYNRNLTYGVYQIFAEIDTSHKDAEGNVVWDHIEVHSALATLKELVRNYYNTEIVPTLFEYEFLK